MKNSAIDITDIPFIDLAKYRKFKEEGKIECVWLLDSLHEGKVYVESMFEGLLKIPICRSHYIWHCSIMTLCIVGGVPIEEILNMSRRECMGELGRRGLVPTRS